MYCIKVTNTKTNRVGYIGESNQPNFLGHSKKQIIVCSHYVSEVLVFKELYKAYQYIKKKLSTQGNSFDVIPIEGIKDIKLSQVDDDIYCIKVIEKELARYVHFDSLAKTYCFKEGLTGACGWSQEDAQNNANELINGDTENELQVFVVQMKSEAEN